MVEWGSVAILGFVLILLGVLLVFMGVLMSAMQGSQGSRGGVEAGGVVVIGPIPIIFGSSSRAAIIAGVLGLALMVMALVFYYMARRGVPG
ncbi:MAG: DUF131 domain-containing protein [Desulfurococcales archaeon]|nr:DUF131 domain-containing protein [Desulfurococcales archaeon]